MGHSPRQGATTITRAWTLSMRTHIRGPIGLHTVNDDNACILFLAVAIDESVINLRGGTAPSVCTNAIGIMMWTHTPDHEILIHQPRGLTTHTSWIAFIGVSS